MCVRTTKKHFVGRSISSLSFNPNPMEHVILGGEGGCCEHTVLPDRPRLDTDSSESWTEVLPNRDREFRFIIYRCWRFSSSSTAVLNKLSKHVRRRFTRAFCLRGGACFRLRGVGVCRESGPALGWRICSTPVAPWPRSRFPRKEADRRRH